MVKKIDTSYITDMAEEMSTNNMVSYDDLPKYDLFLSQVIDFLNDKFTEDKYTNNIVQNYIKSEVITKPEDGKKRGYTKIHLVQLVLLSYMRPVLTTEEIKKVFSLAFNEINDRSDDIISWERAYKIFAETQSESFKEFLATSAIDEEKLNEIISELDLNEKDENSIRTFVIVMSLIAQASAIKKLVQKIVNEYHSE
ncbi:DUF1836 domain-containing protein [Clostridium septicum]|uniref:DUF1836 domain-containing protein n=1 Tax=Clostridium septicum TaxID=1504 RepID=A0A9N7JLN7_CLOSE|nr:DUF1836 domain-containing protein [Clostridium septicum]AYE34161.1 DUF1836 domain-containing protein [Clostridium septicum]MDU1313041.1 DUF1836 domain-containing protein [Clostridium septicum]QAS59529.1 DUF1836 domain-containing protein [Clostridium septicum]UEC21210.1 DUF1836 domain-containing protein [Clostridium septicum]USS00743.1 DUF1836 domain-containing protein [Clostridium septicum]